MEKRLPAVSVVTPVFNGASFVASTIESVLQQTFDDFEYILVDDGSSDDSFDVIKSFAEKDSRIRVVRQPNMGMAEARNCGVKMARGMFIVLQDHDDIALPCRLEVQFKKMQTDEQIGIVAGSVERFDATGKRLGICAALEGHDDIIRAAVMGEPCIGPGTMMIRKSVFDSVGFFRNQYVPSDDLDFIFRASHVCKIVSVKDVVTRYLVHNENATHRSALRMLRVSYVMRYRMLKELAGEYCCVSALNDPTSENAMFEVARGYERQFWSSYVHEVLSSGRIDPILKRHEVELGLKALRGKGIDSRRRVMSRILRCLPDSLRERFGLFWHLFRV
ncbi:glycosyltransferase family 2 protein [Nitratidesulfovibrio vulgaris]|uniref:glycosyltransferase family 2 protein n=1 Tax=Nitratidesulfovibrio vulgaris TaxID=881 RepID=UPI0013DF030E|nr:glycosyltransferase [Nitratidesulfovibrio vulgaris]